MKRPAHLLQVTDLSAARLHALFELAAQLKRRPHSKSKALAGKVLALIFQKPSLRTRVSFEVAVRRLGGSTCYLGPDDAQLGDREPIQDVARTLSRYVDGIILRTFRHAHVEACATHASVPVINGLSDLHHPCQALADLFTIQERLGRLKGVTMAYVGDGNNVLHSLLQGASLLGVNMAVATPPAYRPHSAIWRQAVRAAAAQKAALSWSPHPHEAVRSADVVYTDVWTSMGQEQERQARHKAFRGFQVNGRLLAHASRRAIVMHCLPAHRGEEISEDVVDGARSVVFDQAENRLHVQQALLAMLYKRISS